MLANLHVKNLALIEEADVNFSEGLNILTGETGAGKSIIIGSINLALGGKVNGDIIRNGADYALIEAVFYVEDKEKILLLQELGVEELSEGQIIISRKIMPGKSIIKVNGETVTLSFVKEITSYLLDIHGQHEHQSLLYKSNHLNILDKFVKNEISEYMAELKALYNEYKALKEKFAEYDIDEEKRIREVSFLEYVVNEISAANLMPNEDVELQNSYKKLVNGKKIIEDLSYTSNALGIDSSDGMASMISQGIKSIQHATQYDEALENILNILYDFENLYNDASHEISSYINNFEFNQQAFNDIEERLDTINNLKAKYGATIEAVMEHLEECLAKLSEYQNLEENKQKLIKEIEKVEGKIDLICQKISAIRKQAAITLEKNIVDALMDLNFNDVRFNIQFRELEEFTAKGKDSVEFLISTNPGEDIKPLEKVASGGELSRIMLALKAVTAQNDSIDSLIFDEIDTGISGRTAQKVAEKMAYIAKEHQVICITHLPQIAAMADTHFLIEKNVSDDKTITSIKILEESEMFEELGRMLGGAEVTEGILNSAKEMKELAKKAKNI